MKERRKERKKERKFSAKSKLRNSNLSSFWPTNMDSHVHIYFLLCRGQGVTPFPPSSYPPCNTYISEMFYKVKMHETCALRVRTVNLLSFHCYCYCCCYCCLFVFHKRAFCILCSVYACEARCRLPHSTKVFAKMFSLQFAPSRSRTRLRLRLCVSACLVCSCMCNCNKSRR